VTVTYITIAYILLYLIRQSFEIRLECLNADYLKKHDSIPKHLEGKMSEENFHTAINYNLDSFKYSLVYRLVNIPIHWFFLITGFFWLDTWVRSFGYNSYLTGLFFLGTYSLINGLLDLPFNLYHDFVLEERYDFNKKTLKLFISDMIKSTLLGIILGGAVVLGILWVMGATGTFWWIYATIFMIFIQLLIMWIAPTIILPMFNKLTPLEGEIRSEINTLAQKADFPTTDVLTMDGSRRSSHSNAFFTGFGKAKRIIFFDTLIAQMSIKQIISVLAHEMGHYKLGHIRKKLGMAILGMIIFFGLLAMLKENSVFYASLGFQESSNYAALMIFSIIFTELVFPFTFLFNRLSRKHEYQADAFAIGQTNDPDSMVTALETLHETNLSAPVTHPAYAAYHYSHPALPERIEAIRKIEHKPTSAKSA